MQQNVKKYKCSVCGYVYDPSAGAPDSGINPGTPLEELSDTWRCPVCGAAKSEFEPLEGALIEKILFLCRENSARSQIAEGIVNHLFSYRFKAFSAGVELKEVHPLAIEVMKEIGIDISSYKSKHLNQFMGEEFDYVITVCAGDKKNLCPFFPGKTKKKLSWEIPDPVEKGDITTFRNVRDEIKKRIEQIVESEEIKVKR